MKKINKYFELRKNISDPFIFFKNARGLGDIVASILHSKYIGLFLYIITGKFEACVACQKRRYALNLLFPVNFSKFFYKNEEEKFKNIESFLRKDNKLSEKEIEIIKNEIQNSQKKFENLKNTKILNTEDSEFFENYILLTVFNNQHEDFYITTKIYKKK
jgi:hypothetical protein